MKALIWVGCMLITTILNVLQASKTGILLGFLFYIPMILLAMKLCTLWDRHKLKQQLRTCKAQKQNATEYGYGTVADSGTHKLYFCPHCNERLLPGSAFCRKCGAKIK